MASSPTPARNVPGVLSWQGLLGSIVCFVVLDTLALWAVSPVIRDSSRQRRLKSLTTESRLEHLEQGAAAAQQYLEVLRGDLRATDKDAEASGLRLKRLEEGAATRDELQRLEQALREFREKATAPAGKSND